LKLNLIENTLILPRMFSQRRVRVCVGIYVYLIYTHFLSRFMVQQKSSACERKLWCRTKATFLSYTALLWCQMHCHFTTCHFSPKSTHS